MHNSYIKWLYALRFVTCKVSVDAFSFSYSKLLLAKLCLFAFGATFAEWHWQFISIRSCFIRDYCLSMVERPWLSRFESEAYPNFN